MWRVHLLCQYVDSELELAMLELTCLKYEMVPNWWKIVEMVVDEL